MNTISQMVIGIAGSGLLGVATCVTTQFLEITPRERVVEVLDTVRVERRDVVEVPDTVEVVKRVQRVVQMPDTTRWSYNALSYPGHTRQRLLCLHMSDGRTLSGLDVSINGRRCIAVLTWDCQEVVVRNALRDKKVSALRLVLEHDSLALPQLTVADERALRRSGEAVDHWVTFRADHFFDDQYSGLTRVDMLDGEAEEFANDGSWRIKRHYSAVDTQPWLRGGKIYIGAVLGYAFTLQCFAESTRNPGDAINYVLNEQYRWN